MSDRDIPDVEVVPDVEVIPGDGETSIQTNGRIMP